MSAYNDSNYNPGFPEPNNTPSDQAAENAVDNTEKQDPANEITEKDQPDPSQANTGVVINDQTPTTEPSTVSGPPTKHAMENNNDTPNPTTQTQPDPNTPNQTDDSAVVVNTSSGGSGGKLKKFALPVLGVLLLVLSVGSGVVLVRQNQNIEEEASENCVPPTAGPREWWSVEIKNNNDGPLTDTGQITGIEPGTHQVVVEAWSDSAFGCGTNQQDETAAVELNGQVVNVTDTDVPGSTTVQVQIGENGILNIAAKALGNPGSMFVFVRVPLDAPVACEIPPADGRLILNFEDENSLLQSIQEAQSMNVNSEGESYRVLIQLVNSEGNKEFFVVLIDNVQDSIFITRTNSIESLPDDLESYEELSDDNITLGPDMSSLEALISSYTGQDAESISIICASFEEYDLEEPPNPTPTIKITEISCSQVSIYDDDWNPLSTTQLTSLSAGDIIRLAVTGSASNGSFDKARFKINDGDWIESSENSPGEADTFYTEYTIPEDESSFEMSGQVHHLETNSWY